MSVLNIDTVGMEDDFFDLGGDSLTAEILCLEIERVTDLAFTTTDLFYATRPNEIVSGFYARFREIQNSENAPNPGVNKSQHYVRDEDETKRIFDDWNQKLESWEKDDLPPILALNQSGAKPPIIWVFNSPIEPLVLAQHLPPEQPLIVLRSPLRKSVKGIESFDDIFLDHLQSYSIRLKQIFGGNDFFVGGNCRGGQLAMQLSEALSRSTTGLSGAIYLGYAPKRILNIPTLIMLGDKQIAEGKYPIDSGTLDDLLRMEIDYEQVLGENGNFFSRANITLIVKVLTRPGGILNSLSFHEGG